MPESPAATASRSAFERKTGREVLVIDYQATDDRLTIVLGTRADPFDEPTVVATRATLGTSAQAARWRAAGATLWLRPDGAGGASLCGATTVLPDLEFVDPNRLRARSDANADRRNRSVARTG